MQNWPRLISRAKTIKALYLAFGILLSYFFLITQFSYAAEVLPNTGLIKDNIWFSKDPFYLGDRIRIYSIIGNGSDKDLRGDVNFYDGDSLICNTKFFVLAGRVTEAWCDWGVPSGAHTINVKIYRVKASLPGVPEVDVELSSNVLGTSQKFVAVPPPKQVEATQIAPLSGSEQRILSRDNETSASVVPKDNIISSAVTSVVGSVQKIKDEIFGSDKKNETVRSSQALSPKKISKSVVSKNPWDKRESALSNVDKIKKEIEKVVVESPVLSNTASIYTAVESGLFTPLNRWLDDAYKYFTKGTDNRPLFYLATFIHFVFKYVIFTTYFLILLVVYLLYFGIRRLYRKYRES